VLWLFDSFEGLPAPGPKEKLIDDIFDLGSMRRYNGAMVSLETAVLGRLKVFGFPRESTKVREGWIKETLQRGVAGTGRVRLCRSRLFEPIKDALSFVDTHMPPEGASSSMFTGSSRKALSLPSMSSSLLRRQANQVFN
jgi:hypothetical protein